MNKNRKAKVSIIIPVWNGERFLESALNSVVNQTYENLEIILVDDCSTDESFPIMKKFASLDSRIIVVRNQRNSKLPASLNIGFSVATGDWHTWTSDDNILDPDFIETLLAFAESQDLEFVYSNYQIIDEFSNFVQTSFVDPPTNLYKGNCIGASFLYRNEIFSNLGGYDESKAMYEDYDFWIRILKSGARMGICPSAPYSYRIHSGQLSNTQRLPKDFVKYRWSVASELGSNPPRDLARVKISILGTAIRNKYLWLGGKLLLSSLICHPWSTIMGFSDWVKRSPK